MTSEVDALFSQFGDTPRVLVRRGVFAGITDGVARVDMGDSRFACDWGTGYIPTVGETVQVLTVDARHLLFPAKALPGTGTVLTAAGNRVNVQTTAGTYSLPYVGTAPTSGDLVGISWSETPFIIGKLSTSTPPPSPVPPPVAGQTRSATFQAIDTGSSDRGRARWWQAQPWASDSTFGAWFYGTQIKDTIPAAAQFVSLEFYVSWQSRSGDSPRFVLHNAASKGDLPGYSAPVSWAPAGGWQTPPGAQDWFNALKAGGSWWGVGLNQGGYSKFSSRAQDSMTGALRISWRS